jgi:hypothetical protein
MPYLGDTQEMPLTSEKSFKKSLNLRNIARVVVIPSGDCIPT